MHTLENSTARISQQVSEVTDPLWQFELAALAANGDSARGRNTGFIANVILQIVSFSFAIATLGWLIVRHGGTPEKEARRVLAHSASIVAVHGEDTTRTRPMRQALAIHRSDNPAEPLPILLLGRPITPMADQFAALNISDELTGLPVLRPLTIKSFLRSLPAMLGQMLDSFRQTASFRGAIPLRERVAMAYRFVQGAAYSRWWDSASAGCKVETALFAHTGNADTSQLELAMQKGQTRTVHVVHGTNIGWPFAGLSDFAIFPSGADAILAGKLPAYGKSAALPLSKPAIGQGNGKWALLTSYTHLQNPAYTDSGASADIALVQLVRKAADAMGQAPTAVLWRPHPQIKLVCETERDRLERAVTEAGFSRWPAELPYAELGAFSAVVTTPSTVMTDALRLGQPAIVASLTPMQNDLPYALYPLLVQDEDALRKALSRVLDPGKRGASFSEAWSAIQPGGGYRISAILKRVES